MKQLDYNNWNGVFSMWSVLRCYKQGTKLVESSAEFCMGGCEDKTWTREAKKSALLEAVARERLVKIQQAGKGFARAVVICDLWQLAVAL
jgi:hypothetical protein